MRKMREARPRGGFATTPRGAAKVPFNMLMCNYLYISRSRDNEVSMDGGGGRGVCLRSP